MTAAALTVPAFTRPGLIEALIGSIVSVIAGIFPPLFAAEAEAGDDYSDMDLSEEELAALEDEDDDDQGGDNNDNGEGDDDDDNDPDKDDNDGQKNDGVDSDSDGQADDDPDANSSEDDAGDPEDDADPDEKTESEKDSADARPDANGVGDDQPKDVESIYKDKIAALDQKLDDGNIDFDEYKKEILSLGEARTRDMVREEMARTTAENIWKAEQNAFFSEHGYLKDNPIVYESYAREVNRLLEDKEWGSKPGPDILAEAKKNIDSAFGIKPGEKSDLPPEKKEKTLGQKAVDKAKKANAEKAAPKTLKDVPAADKNTDGAFDHLDDLDGQELEAAIEKMTPAEREAYEDAI